MKLAEINGGEFVYKGGDEFINLLKSNLQALRSFDLSANNH